MNLDVLEFVSVFFYAIALAPGLAHAAELPNKLPMSADDYLVAQRSYRGWQFFGIAQVVAVVATLLLAIEVAGTPRFVPVLVASIAMVVTLVVFFAVVFPVNKTTKNWTQLVPEWERARLRWEYGHATNFGITLIGFVFLLLGR